jgi:DNA-binding ferritin-like protein
MGDMAISTTQNDPSGNDPYSRAIDQTDELGDWDTADIFTEISRGVDKYHWFVEAHHG